jgi:hypothetical protein
MTWRQRAVFAAFVVIASITSVTGQQSFAMTQQSMLMIGDDDVMIRGCVRPADPHAYTSVDMIVWGHGNVMLTGGLTPVTRPGNSTPHAVGTAGFANRVLYWLEDDEDLLEYLGQRVEIRGDLKDFERGEIEVEREGAYTKIELDLHGRKETIRLPTTWFTGTGTDRGQDIDIVARRIDVDDDVRVLGVCH